MPRDPRDRKPLVTPNRRPARSGRRGLHLDDEEMEQLVAEALDELPEEFAALLDNVAVTLHPEPTDDDLESVGIDPDEPGAKDELFGLYQGVPLAFRDSFYDALPDRIVIFADPIRRACTSRRQAIDEVKKTVLHELGHHFGLDEDDMPY